MAIDYRKTAGELVRELGGNENIINVTHCATRLRFILKDESVVDKDRVAKVPGVITTVQAGGQFQVVIGNHVKDAYGFVTQLVSIDEEEAQKSSGQKAGIFTRIVDVISAIFAPFLYTLAACGILQGILGVLAAMNLINTAGGTYPELYILDGIYLPSGHDSGDGGQKIRSEYFYCGRNCMCSGEPGLHGHGQCGRAGILPWNQGSAVKLYFFRYSHYSGNLDCFLCGTFL